MKDHVFEVFFVYGLAFFLLGTTIFLHYRRDSSTKLGKSLWLLGSFGLLHGVSEWMDMFAILGESHWTVNGMQTLQLLSYYFCASSYVFLLQFGLQSTLPDHFNYLKPVVLVVSLFIVLTFCLQSQCNEPPGHHAFTSLAFQQRSLHPRRLFATPGPLTSPRSSIRGDCS